MSIWELRKIYGYSYNFWYFDSEGWSIKAPFVHEKSKYHKVNHKTKTVSLFYEV